MAQQALLAATALAALGSGLVAGVLFAFSSFVMPALARLAPAEGIRAMQAINLAAVRAPFMLAFFGTAFAALLLALAAFTRPEVRGVRVALLAGSGLYLVGVLALTAAYHVPRNDALAALDPSGAGAEAAWRAYFAGWTAWNHLRCAAATAACSAFVVALRG